jgi:hypothetical protein
VRFAGNVAVPGLSRPPIAKTREMRAKNLEN